MQLAGERVWVVGACLPVTGLGVDALFTANSTLHPELSSSLDDSGVLCLLSLRNRCRMLDECLDQAYKSRLSFKPTFHLRREETIWDPQRQITRADQRTT